MEQKKGLEGFEKKLFIYDNEGKVEKLEAWIKKVDGGYDVQIFETSPVFFVPLPRVYKIKEIPQKKEINYGK